jgi:hypothetical protein
VVRTGSIRFSSQGNADIKDITRDVLDILKESEIDSGVVTIFCPSATSALTTIEHESGALSDFRGCLMRLQHPIVSTLIMSAGATATDTAMFERHCLDLHSPFLLLTKNVIRYLAANYFC